MDNLNKIAVLKKKKKSNNKNQSPFYISSIFHIYSDHSYIYA